MPAADGPGRVMMRGLRAVLGRGVREVRRAEGPVRRDVVVARGHRLQCAGQICAQVGGVLDADGEADGGVVDPGRRPPRRIESGVRHGGRVHHQ